MRRRPLPLSACVLVLALGLSPPAGAEEEETGFTPARPDEETTGIREALEGASGVRVETMCTNCNVANVTMSGMSGERVQVWKDGLPVMGGLGAIYLLSVMPSEGIRSTEVVRGAGTVLSGAEASAGALFLETRSPEGQKRPSISASADFGGLDWRGQKVLASGSLGRWGGEIVATRAESRGSDPNGDGNLDLGAFDRTTVAGTATFEISRSSRLRFDALSYSEDQRGSKGAYIGSALLLPEDFGQFGREDIDIRREEYSLAWDYRFRDGSRIDVRGRYARREQDTSDNITAESPYMFVDEFSRQVQVRYERGMFERHLLRVGAAYRNFEVDGTNVKSDILFPEGQSLQDFIRHKGGFVEAEFALPHRMNITAGLRYDQLDWTPGENSTVSIITGEIGKREHSRASPRFRFAWKATPELALSLSAGYAFLAPRPVFERVCCGALVLSNATAEPEISRNLLLDADWVPERWLKIRGSLFRSDFRDYLQKLALFASPYFIPTFAEANYSRFRFQGREISLELRPMERLSWGFEWTRIRTRSEGPITLSFVGSPAYDLPVDQIPNVPENQGSAFARWNDADMGLEVSAQAQYTGSMYVQKMEQPIGLVDTFAKTPGYWIYNFRVRQRVYRWISAFAGIDNITDEYQLALDDPRFEYNWGPLRGRYVYGGIAFEM